MPTNEELREALISSVQKLVDVRQDLMLLQARLAGYDMIMWANCKDDVFDDLEDMIRDINR